MTGFSPPPSSGSNHPNAQQAHPILLVVDDEPQVLQSLYDLFRRHYQVVTFERASDALATLSGLNPQVVMTDQRMPGMTGVEFLREVRLQLPDATRLLFTGFTNLDTVIAAVNEGHIYRYITKPYDAQELAMVVRQAFEQNALRVERRQLIYDLQQANTRLAESNRLKEQFIEVASHELNTPAGVVLGMAELWSLSIGEKATAQERFWVDRIRQAGLRLSKTVERMMHLLNSDRLGDMLQLEPTDLNILIQGVIHELEPFVQARKQTLVFQAELGLGTANLDAVKIGDVLINLIVNAIKFTPDQGTIRVSAGPDGPERVMIEVADTGVGIPAQEMRFLFEPFFTGYDTRHHSSGEYQFGKRGIGLGLNLVKRFVEMHGGSVSAQSEQGRGSTFRVVLPRASITVADHTHSVEVAQTAPVGASGPSTASGSGTAADAVR